MNVDNLKVGDRLFSIKHNMWFTLTFMFKRNTFNIVDFTIRSDERIQNRIPLVRRIKYSAIGNNYITEIQYKVKRRNTIIEDLL